MKKTKLPEQVRYAILAGIGTLSLIALMGVSSFNSSAIDEKIIEQIKDQASKGSVIHWTNTIIEVTKGGSLLISKDIQIEKFIKDKLSKLPFSELSRRETLLGSATDTPVIFKNVSVNRRRIEIVSHRQAPGLEGIVIDTGPEDEIPDSEFPLIHNIAIEYTINSAIGGSGPFEGFVGYLNSPTPFSLKETKTTIKLPENLLSSEIKIAAEIRVLDESFEAGEPFEALKGKSDRPTDVYIRPIETKAYRPVYEIGTRRPLRPREVVRYSVMWPKGFIQDR